MQYGSLFRWLGAATGCDSAVIVGGAVLVIVFLFLVFRVEISGADLPSYSLEVG